MDERALEEFKKLAEANFKEQKDRIQKFYLQHCVPGQKAATQTGQTGQPEDQQESLEALRAQAKDYLSHLRGQR